MTHYPDACTLPSFSSVEPKNIVSAVQTMLADAETQIDRIRNAEPSWAATVVPLELLQHQIACAWSPIGHMNGVVNAPELREAYNQCLPMLSDFQTRLGQDEKLYRAYTAVEKNEPGLDAEQRQVLKLALEGFRLAGVGLDPNSKKLFMENASRLAELQSKFEENVLDAGNGWTKFTGNSSVLIGLPGGVLDAAANNAKAEGKTGWLLRLDHPTYHAVMTHAEDESLRREFYEAWVTRASNQGPHAGHWDNTGVMDEILNLRHANARLLAFDNFAEYSVAPKMAASAGEVSEFLEELASQSLEPARKELGDLEEFAGKQLNAWDLAFFSEKLKQQRFGISEEALRPYFPLPKVLKGMFEVAKRLFGIRLVPGAPVDTWHPDAAYFDVLDAKGRVTGGLYTDFYARKGKRGGAWMDECVGRVRTRQINEHPVAYLVCNFMPPNGDQPALLTHYDVVTMFHEFGHSLHHLLTRARFPSVSGINGVPWDAVELPSQLMENFCWEPEVLPLISGHYQTGVTLPEDMLQTLLGSRQFQSAMQLVRQIEFSLFDLKVHADYDPARGSRVAETIAAVREQVAVLETPEWNRFAHSFSHIFAGGYAAGYYSYKWAEVLAADAYAAFSEEGLFDADVANRYRENILAKGGARDALENFVAFRGREPRNDALLSQAGIDVASAKDEAAATG